MDELAAHPELAPQQPDGHRRASACVADPVRWWPNPGEDPVAEHRGVGVAYGGNPAVVDVSFPVPSGSIVALIGPSGSGMVFQKPNPFPKSIYDNVAFGPRCLAVEPDVLLMDEPASALDPISTSRIEQLMRELVPALTIVIVTHNLQQAGRVSDLTAFLTADTDPDGRIVGRLVEFGPTGELFSRPSDDRTEAYLTGRFG